MNCPKCKSNKSCKDGKMHGRQRHLCKVCKYHDTVTQRSGTATLATKRQALELYLEWLGFRSIGRILNFSNVSLEHTRRRSLFNFFVNSYLLEKIETILSPYQK